MVKVKKRGTSTTLRLPSSLALLTVLLSAVRVVLIGAPARADVLLVQPPSSTPIPALATSDGRIVTSAGGATARTLVTLDVKTVTTGGTAVTAIAAGNRTAGGWLSNPVGASVALCINEIGVAVGTTSSGDTTCIAPGASYNLSPSLLGVSVITSDSAHPFSGYGYQ